MVTYRVPFGIQYSSAIFAKAMKTDALKSFEILTREIFAASKMCIHPCKIFTLV